MNYLRQVFDAGESSFQVQRTLMYTHFRRSYERLDFLTLNNISPKRPFCYCCSTGAGKVDGGAHKDDEGVWLYSSPSFSALKKVRRQEWHQPRFD
jgi:hypothetical protein